MILREATRCDIPAIARVHVKTWQTTYRGILPDEFLKNLSYERRENSWHQVFENASKDKNFTYVAQNRSGEIVGFANGGLERTGNVVYQGELNAIYILKSDQQKGIGRTLYRAVVQRLAQMQIHSMLVWVLEKNPACQFYDIFGGRIIDKKEIEIGGTNLAEIAYGWIYK
ncbi:GNAT family N-acetyltransferase [Nodosilinea sp. LEGE 07088]|nr:GNAT family N-acetyltransferase [Nodosilinea sp. LEGE 07088]